MMSMDKKPMLMGAVAYAPKVVTIWEGFKEYFYRHNFNFDYILYSNYEHQVEAQFAGAIDVAWNSPLAWVRADLLARSKNLKISAVAMRDTDRDLTSVLVARSNSKIAMTGNLHDLAGMTLGFGAVDSPQATLIPLRHLQAQNMHSGIDFKARNFDVLGGKHGDHIGGERDAAIALMKGEIDAAWMIDGNQLAFSREGILPAGETKIVASTGVYDHCNFTTSPHASAEKIARFTELLFSMKWEDPQVRPLLELEGLKAWLPGRISGYEMLIQANHDQRFYDEKGSILVDNYRY